MSYLLIVESPGKIKKITEYLGNDYIVAASVGHIIDLDEKTMSINLETFEPEYKIYDNKKDVVDKLKKLTTKVGKDNVFLAADEDREGEMIAWSCARELKINKPKRIVFNSITAKELKNAVANPKLIDMNMVKAQQARRILDRFAGYLISPILKKNGFYAAKSAGRVQSVVVKILVDKEKEIQNFFSQKKSTYFYINCDTIVGDFEITTKLANKNTKVEIDGKDGKDETDDTDETDETDETDDSDVKDKKKKNTKAKSKTNTKNTVSNKSYLTFDKSDEEKVVKIIKAMMKGTYSLLNKTERVRKANAPPPFTTSTLQQSAQRIGMDAKRTMSVAQKLYEGGHITYMRTDSTAISEEASKLIKDVIEAEYGLENYEHHTFVNKKANTQEAHECVRPTKPQYDQIDGTAEEKRLYNMIWKRTIQSQMKASEYQSILIEIQIDDKKNVLEDYKLVGTLENLIYEGWLMVDGKKKSTPLDIKKLKNIDWKEINGIEDTQKPPTRYNEASLINKMDPKNLNIGRPSTYAAIIDKIQQRLYVQVKNIEGTKIQVSKYIGKKSSPKEINMETKDLVLGKETKKLVPTELGITVTEFLEKNFSQIMDYQFTANMEKELDDVAEGELSSITVMKKFYDYVISCIGKLVPNHVFGQATGQITGNNANGPIVMIQPLILGNHKSIDIKLSNGQYGKYITYGTNSYNLKQLSKEFDVEEDELEKDNKKICDLVIKKISNPPKEWKIGKTSYILKKGQYGHYIEEISTKKKKTFYSIKYLISKIAKDNDMDIESDDDVKQVIQLITNDNIKETIEYCQNKNENKNKNDFKAKK